MTSTDRQPRLTVELEFDDPALDDALHEAARRDGLTVSEYYLEALWPKLSADGFSVTRRPLKATPERLARWAALEREMDELSNEIGPIGVRTSDLVREGRTE